MATSDSAKGLALLVLASALLFSSLAGAAPRDAQGRGGGTEAARPPRPDSSDSGRPSRPPCPDSINSTRPARPPHPDMSNMPPRPADDRHDNPRGGRGRVLGGKGGDRLEGSNQNATRPPRPDSSDSPRPPRPDMSNMPSRPADDHRDNPTGGRGRVLGSKADDRLKGNNRNATRPPCPDSSNSTRPSRPPHPDMSSMPPRPADDRHDNARGGRGRVLGGKGGDRREGQNDTRPPRPDSSNSTHPARPPHPEDKDGSRPPRPDSANMPPRPVDGHRDGHHDRLLGRRGGGGSEDEPRGASSDALRPPRPSDGANSTRPPRPPHPEDKDGSNRPPRPDSMPPRPAEGLRGDPRGDGGRGTQGRSGGRRAD